MFNVKTVFLYCLNLLTTKPVQSIWYRSAKRRQTNKRSPIRVFARHFMASHGPKASSGGQRRLSLACTNAQANLSLRYTHVQYCRKCCVLVQTFQHIYTYIDEVNFCNELIMLWTTLFLHYLLDLWVGQPLFIQDCVCAQGKLCAGWSESSLSGCRGYGSLAAHRVTCEDSDQTAWMRRLIWVFTGRICHLAGNAVPRLKILIIYVHITDEVNFYKDKPWFGRLYYYTSCSLHQVCHLFWVVPWKRVICGMWTARALVRLRIITVWSGLLALPMYSEKALICLRIITVWWGLLALPINSLRTLVRLRIVTVWSGLSAFPVYLVKVSRFCKRSPNIPQGTPCLPFKHICIFLLIYKLKNLAFFFLIVKNGGEESKDVWITFARILVALNWTCVFLIWLHSFIIVYIKR